MSSSLLASIGGGKSGLLAWGPDCALLYQKCCDSGVMGKCTPVLLYHCTTVLLYSGVMGRCTIAGCHPLLYRSMMMANVSQGELDNSHPWSLLWYLSLSFSDSWCLRFERKNSSCAVCSSSERLYTLEVFGSIPNGTVIKYALVLLGWTQRHRCQEVSGVDADVWGELGWVRWGCRSWADWTKGRVGRALGHLAKDGKLIGAAEDRRAVPPTHSPWNIFLPTRPQLTTSTLETEHF